MKKIVWFVFVLGALRAAGKVIVSKPGQKVVLKCGVDTFARNLEWRRGGDMIINVPKKGFSRRGSGDIVARSSVSGETNLQISVVKEEDAGKFMCAADGFLQEHTLILVSVSASPPGALQLGSEATLQCRVGGQDSAVQWRSPKGHQHPETVHLKSVARSDEGTWECSFSHEGGVHTDSLVITVKEPEPDTPSPTQSSKDVSKPPSVDGVTPSPPGAALLLGLSWWVWVAVGVGGLVVFLLVILVIVLCKRINRRKRKFRKMKNGGLPLKPKKYCQCDRPAAAAKPQQGRRREKPSAPPLQPLLM